MEDIEEKRQSLRIDMESDNIIVIWLDHNQHKQVVEASCIDLSRRGVLFVYHESFALGELLNITFNPNNDNKHTVKGQVCRSANIGNTYQVAVQLIDLN
jgi:hypothetical protein